MVALGEQLQQYVAAVADPTRGMILVELDRAGELTATQLARRLNLTANNVYHHMRVLLNLGVVNPPRIVPGDTYVEKYYHINPEIRAVLRLDPEWFRRTQDTLSPEERQLFIVSVCLAMSHCLRRAAQEYQELDPQTLDRYVREDKLVLLSLNRISREHLEYRLDALRRVLEEEGKQFAEDLGPRTDLMVIAGLPTLSTTNGS
jgi:DNA-binding transcriptional ArsR family regulator